VNAFDCCYHQDHNLLFPFVTFYIGKVEITHKREKVISWPTTQRKGKNVNHTYQKTSFDSGRLQVFLIFYVFFPSIYTVKSDGFGICHRLTDEANLGGFHSM
jgi:hypothetical protein